MKGQILEETDSGSPVRKIVTIRQIETVDRLADQGLGHLTEIDIPIGQGHQQTEDHTDILDLGQERNIENLGQSHQIECHIKETEKEILGQVQERDTDQDQKKKTDIRKCQDLGLKIRLDIAVLAPVIVH